MLEAYGKYGDRQTCRIIFQVSKHLLRLHGSKLPVAPCPVRVFRAEPNFFFFFKKLKI